MPHRHANAVSHASAKGTFGPVRLVATTLSDPPRHDVIVAACAGGPRQLAGPFATPELAQATLDALNARDDAPERILNCPEDYHQL